MKKICKKGEKNKEEAARKEARNEKGNIEEKYMKKGSKENDCHIKKYVKKCLSRNYINHDFAFQLILNSIIFPY